MGILTYNQTEVDNKMTKKATILLILSAAEGINNQLKGAIEGIFLGFGLFHTL
jgi:hypothetical protein